MEHIVQDQLVHVPGVDRLSSRDFRQHLNLKRERGNSSRVGVCSHVGEGMGREYGVLRLI